MKTHLLSTGLVLIAGLSGAGLALAQDTTGGAATQQSPNAATAQAATQTPEQIAARAAAEAMARTIAAAYQAEGYGRIEVDIDIDHRGTRIEIDAIRGDTKIEAVHDAQTGAVITSRFEPVDRDDVTTPGVFVDIDDDTLDDDRRDGRDDDDHDDDDHDDDDHDDHDDDDDDDHDDRDDD